MSGLRSVGRLFARGSSGRAFSDFAKSEVGVANGITGDEGRKVSIYSPSRSAGQQGLGNTTEAGPAWYIEFHTREKWINPVNNVDDDSSQVMGWTSTSDAYEHQGRSQLYFATKDDAVAFAEKKGWIYDVSDPPKPNRMLRPKRFNAYGDNYSVKRKGTPVGGLISENSAAKK